MSLLVVHREQATAGATNEVGTKATKKRKLGTIKNPPPPPPSDRASSPSSSLTDSSVSTIKAEKKKAVTKKNAATDSKTAGLSDDDIRTKYARIFCEIFNDFERESFSAIVRNYCEPDLLVIYEFVGDNPYGGPSYIEVRGLDTVVLFWDSVLKTIPDALFVIHATKYKVLPNSYISIVCSFTFRGTKVYMIPGLEVHVDEKVIVSIEKMSLGDGAAPAPQGEGKMIATLPTSGEQNSPVDASGATWSCDIERSKMISTAMSVVGTLTFYVNPEKKIYRISFVHSIRTAESSVTKNKGK
jgi:hypothetical protein